MDQKDINALPNLKFQKFQANFCLYRAYDLDLIINNMKPFY